MKLDATYQEDERVMAAGAQAELLFIRSICCCRRRVTDGFVPQSALRLLSFGIDVDAETLAFTLVENELWLIPMRLVEIVSTANAARRQFVRINEPLV